ncbi:MAG: aminoacyl-tRNA hydrolase [Eubacteriales bacterium]|nr:aminoacyl-tRNA hydrolase [Eubacteriales bacterium]
MKNGRNKLIVGLGNPGDKYELSWHNLGWLAVDLLARKRHLAMRRLRFEAYFDDYRLNEQKVFVMKPLTYMNNSGRAIRQALNFYNLKPEDIIVIYDDIDLDFGILRIRDRGSSAHHNGIKSVISELGSENFTRIRLGFGPQDRSRELIPQVLEWIPKDKQTATLELLEKAVIAAEMIITEGVGYAQARMNGRVVE